MLRRSVAVFLFLLCGVGCASQRPVTVTSPSPRPRWVDTPPSTPEFFYGVGAAPATGYPAEDRQKADYAARVDIASQLEIKIGSVVADLMQYKQTSAGKKTRGEYSAQYSQKISAIVDSGYNCPGGLEDRSKMARPPDRYLLLVGFDVQVGVQNENQKAG